MLANISMITLAYLMGSLSSAIIVCRLLGLPDPRGEGSGNPGATNVLRLGGKKAAIITLVGDFLKGLIPVLIAASLGISEDIQLLVAIAAFLGHLYPVFFSFKGGKGIATTAGVLFGLDWRIGLAALLTWIAIYKWQKISSLAGLSSAAATPLLILLITGSATFTCFGLALTALVFWRHRSNIAKLRAGTET
ncbi:MAG TPA: glycerol-3-phosphate 1-O-acyltransferase [Gammaproteobacteria bacterium]|nr:glycerol-3-phosphate 1-O-acyltransferase [Gammaproteobacteria bacterium]